MDNGKPVWLADMGDGFYRNPVLHADYADPDVIRVEQDFYMISSSFAHTPGLPILHSRDLINWSIIGHVLDKVDWPGYEVPQHGRGVWAPAVRFHEGKFLVYYAMPDEGIFMCKAENPAGPWSKPYLIKKVKGWIDPCPFWDDDGRGYMIHAFANSRCGIKDKLRLVEMTSDNLGLSEKGEIVFDGTENHPVIEGPKLYKRNGYYYIFAPAGGVVSGWQTVLRSRCIWGPYEDRIVLHQGNSEINGPHQGGWVELECGESWFLHFQDKGLYGRIIHLQPMSWEDDWPIIGVDANGDGIGEPVVRWSKPNVNSNSSNCTPDTSDDFAGPALGRQWQWQANPSTSWYSLMERKGSLRLYAIPHWEGAGGSLYNAPQLLLQKLPALEFQVTTLLKFCPDKDYDETGILVFGSQYACLSLKQLQGNLHLSLLHGSYADMEQVLSTTQIASSSNHAPLLTKDIYLRLVVSQGGKCNFFYGFDGQIWNQLEPPVQAMPGKWVGAKMGLYAANRGGLSSAGYVDAEWFRVENLPK